MSALQIIRPEQPAALSLPRPAIIRPDAEWLAKFYEDYERPRHFTTDNFMNFDNASQYTIDSTGAFLISELDRLDQTLHEPLAAVTWARDVDLREDVSMGDDFSSFTLSSFASPGGITPSGIAWIGKETNAVTGISLDIGKITNALTPWGVELRWTLMELAAAEKVGRPVDAQKYDGMKLKYQMDIDQVVYTGDSTMGKYGLINSPLVTPQNVPDGAAGSTFWCTAAGQAVKTPDEILQDVNFLLEATWLAAGTALVPTELRLPPLQFSFIASNKVSDAGNVSIIEFLKKNSLTNASYGQELNIQSIKWLTGAGAAGSNRMIAYTKDKNRVRYPLVPMQHTPVEYRSIWQMTTYYAKLGTLEIVYPETIGYRDGI